MFERFTDRARKVMALAGEEARSFKHEYIGTEHILLGMIKEGNGIGATVLKNLADIGFEPVIKEINRLIKCGPDEIAPGQLPPTPRAKKVVKYALGETRVMKDKYIGTEHLLLGLLRETDGVASQVLVNLGLNVGAVQCEILKLRRSTNNN
jgi:ATP-dependent Clp protease ATP-binding subunit ClpC